MLELEEVVRTFLIEPIQNKMETERYFKIGFYSGILLGIATRRYSNCIETELFIIPFIRLAIGKRDV